MAPSFHEYEAEIKDAMDADAYKEFSRRLPEFCELRLEAMDAAGIDISVLSQTSPGLQAEKDLLVAVRQAREVNDFLAAEIKKQPKRFAGFAHLPMQDPTAATKEVQRCVTELGFKGALINGHTNGIYLDDEIYLPFWEVVGDLDVPVYLHPANSFDTPHMFRGYPQLMGATWGWTFETGTHALRLIASGLFDRLPGLKIILGHMGEALPFMLWRLDSRWPIYKHKKELKKPPSQYIRDNFVITTAGACDAPPLLCSIAAIGVDNVLFSTDYPFESALIAAEFIEKAPISDQEKEKICYLNAERVLKLNR